MEVEPGGGVAWGAGGPGGGGGGGGAGGDRAPRFLPRAVCRPPAQRPRPRAEAPATAWRARSPRDRDRPCVAGTSWVRRPCGSGECGPREVRLRRGRGAGSRGRRERKTPRATAPWPAVALPPSPAGSPAARLRTCWWPAVGLAAAGAGVRAALSGKAASSPAGPGITQKPYPALAAAGPAACRARGG